MAAFQRRVAFLMLTYNQAALVRESAEAVLAQQCEPLDVIFSDDGSSDNTFEVLQSVVRGYTGPHNVCVRRNQNNLGIGEHVNKLIALCPADFYIASAGDDISMPDRAKALIQAWDDSGQKIDLISSHCIQMSFDGRPGDVSKTDILDGLRAIEWMTRRPYVVGATHAFTRRLHLKFGPFARDIVGEDQIMVFRALCSGGAITLDRAYVYYRDGGVSRKPERMSSAQHRSWSLKRARSEVAEMIQVMKDARVAGLDVEARRILSGKLESAHFLSEILAECRLIPMWRIARRFPGVPLLWRCKKALSVRFYAQYHTIDRFNRMRKAWVLEMRGLKPPESI